MKNQTIIRSYHKNDLTELMIAWESANNLAHPFLEEEFIAEIRRDIPAIYLPAAETSVAEIEGHVAGFISMMGNEVAALFLRPEHHGAGVGAALMNKARQHHETLEVEVFVDNSIGSEFYRKYGFQKQTESVHEQTGHRILRMKYVCDEVLNSINAIC